MFFTLKTKSLSCVMYTFRTNPCQGMLSLHSSVIILNHNVPLTLIGVYFFSLCE